MTIRVLKARTTSQLSRHERDGRSTYANLDQGGEVNYSELRGSSLRSQIMENIQEVVLMDMEMNRGIII